MSDYWAIDGAVGALCKIVSETINEASTDQGPLASTVRLTCIGLGLIILSRERQEGQSVELCAHGGTMIVYGSTPPESAYTALELLGWHRSAEAGDLCWKAYP